MSGVLCVVLVSTSVFALLCVLSCSTDRLVYRQPFTFNCRDRQEAQNTEVERAFRLWFIGTLVLRVPLSGWKDRIWSMSL